VLSARELALKPDPHEVVPGSSSPLPLPPLPEEHGLTGSVKLGFCDLVQMLAVNHSSNLVNIVNDRQEGGALWFKAGDIVHAVCGDQSGEEAVATLLAWDEGSFRLEPWREPVRVTITKSVQQLLLECCCRLDEDHRAVVPIDDDLDDGQEEMAMSTLKESLEHLSGVDGFIGACIVDSNSGMMLGSQGGGGVVNLEAAAAGNTEVVRAKRKTMKALGLHDSIEDILITLSKQYHLIRPLTVRDGLFLYLVLDRSKANLALGRQMLMDTEKMLVL
jgi:hypothetical protein